MPGRLLVPVDGVSAHMENVGQLLLAHPSRPTDAPPLIRWWKRRVIPPVQCQSVSQLSLLLLQVVSVCGVFALRPDQGNVVPGEEAPRDSQG
jgi:hypothetical protein